MTDEEDDEGAVSCAYCGRRLRDDPEWLWWQPRRDEDGELRLYCGACDDGDLDG